MVGRAIQPATFSCVHPFGLTNQVRELSGPVGAFTPIGLPAFVAIVRSRRAACS